VTEDFFDLYFSYVGKTECPRIFHRWTAISCVAALIGRDIYMPFGHSEIYPSVYVMLMGAPGTRKSTAIKIGQKLVSTIGYDHFSADRTSKEALWLDMQSEMERNMEGYLGDTDLEEIEINTPTELYIVADEFNDFMGVRNEEFQTALTKMWDSPPEYKTRAKNSASTSIYKPTVNVLGGNTPGGLSKGFGVEAINGGFFSRIIFIHADATGIKIPFPETPPGDIKLQILSRLRRIQDMSGGVELSQATRQLLGHIYHKYPGIPDRRFNYYQTRRHTNLLKLCIVMAAARTDLALSEADVIKANTLLHVTELQMPQAFGEFGLAKNAEVTNTVMEIIRAATRRGQPVTAHEIWKQIYQDLQDQKDLSQILSSLIRAEKIQQARKGVAKGFLIKKKYVTKWENGLIDYDVLTEEEKIGEHSNEEEDSGADQDAG
jgi:hypothetical protein